MVDVGGGFDLRSGKQLKTIDAVFPRSMEGTWNCERVVVSSEGDGFQAESAWKALDGGSRNNGKLKAPEQYQVKFILSAQIGDVEGVVMDRAFEIQSRAGATKIF